MKPYDLSQMTDAQLYELQGRLDEERAIRRRGWIECAPVAGWSTIGYPQVRHVQGNSPPELITHNQVGHYPPADNPPPQPVINHYTE